MRSFSSRRVHPLIAQVFAFADEWSDLPDTATVEARIRARAIVILTAVFLGPAVALPALSAATVFADPMSITIGCLGVLGMAAAPILLRRTGEPRLAGGVLCGSVTLGLGVWPLLSEGLASPHLLILSTTPLLYGLLISARACLVYTVALLVYYPALLFVTPLAALSAPDAFVPTNVYFCIMLMVSAGGCGLGTAGYGIMTNNMLQQVEEASVRSAAYANEADAARAAAEQARAASDAMGERFQMFANIATDWLWETNAEGHVIYFAGRAADRMARPRRELMGEHFLKFLNFRENDMERLADALNRIEPYSDIPVRYLDADGAEFIFELSASPSFNAAGVCTGYVGVGRDVTDRIRAENDVRFLAENDKLTGLANRHTFNTRLDDEIAAVEGRGAALFAIDLDDFKSVNDSYGHHVGDALLIEVAARINSCIRKGDWAARLGGDEFVVISMGYDPDKWTTDLVADRILERLAEPYRIEELELHMSASIGVARFPQDATCARKLTKYADMALYAAKEAGRNQWRAFSPAMEQAATQRKLLETGLRDAMERGQLDVWYQPLVNLSGETVSGFEALARWVDDERGYIPPPVFIDVAEKCGLINELGAYVLQRACSDAAKWVAPKGEPAPRVSVNISAVQFADGGLPGVVAAVLEETGLEPSRLELEITESILMEDIDVAIRMLEALEGLGVSVAIDDFGTGYSSLSYLKRFPLSRLKVDRSFIHDLESDEHDRTITRTVVKLGESLGLAVIAEGVETEGQRAWLKRMGCQEVQGYLFAKPMPSGDVKSFLSDPKSNYSRPTRREKKRA